MKKRILAIILTALLALVAVGALADGTWICPACGTENTDNFCCECGTPRPPQGWTCENGHEGNAGNFCTECGAARPPQTWTCENGHAGNTGNFCSECGAARPDDTAQTTTAPEPVNASALDSAFLAGRAVFVPAELPLPDFRTCDIIVPDAFWEFLNTDPMSDVVLRLALMAGKLTPVSISPDGTHMAAYLETAGIVVPLAVSPNRVAVICPSPSRGVADIYRNGYATYTSLFLAKSASSPMNMGLEGMIWSPDGRYFCSIDCWKLMRTMNAGLNNPILVDTETGDMFLLDTYPRSVKDGLGSIVTGCFSRDGKKFYAFYYGKEYDTLCMPLCYDLETGEKTTWGAGMDAMACPSLAETAEGSLLALCASRSQSDPMFLATMAPGRTTQRDALPVSLGIWETRYAEYSADTGWLVGRGSVMSGLVNMEISAIQRIRPAEIQKEALNTVWAISAETRRPEALSLEDIAVLASSSDKAAVEALSVKYLPIGDMALSPDGRYAAVLAGKAADPFLLVVRLEDMAAVMVEGVPLSDQAMIQLNGIRGIWWSEAGLLVRDGDAAALWTVETNNDHVYS